MRDLIEGLKKHPKLVEDLLAEQKQAWLKELDELFADIERWLEPARSDGVLKIARSTAEIREDDLGSYLAPLLSITDGRLTVRIEPVGTRVVGLVAGHHGGFRGLVNIVCGPYRIPIVRQVGGGWKILPPRGEPRDLNAETLAEILGEILIDA